LLTIAFLGDENANDEEYQTPLKGVDGFAEEHIVQNKRKRRGRKSRNKTTISETDAVIIPKYTPVKINTKESLVSTPDRTPTSQLQFSSGLGPSSQTLQYHIGRAADYHQRSKSDYLMGGAAAYHSSIAREQYAKAKSATTARADQLAANHSSRTHVDLHGIGPDDGKRIALQYVRAWWDGLGEGRIRTGGKSTIGSGFDVIVGKGNHSAGGRSVLGPAVVKALAEGGWKFEIGIGLVNVKGRKN